MKMTMIVEKNRKTAKSIVDSQRRVLRRVMFPPALGGNQSLKGCEVEVLAEKKMNNGVVFTITEQSRVIAADRWYVKVVGVISVPVTDAAFAEIGEEDPILKARVRLVLGDGVEHQLVKDRNFVDAAAKDAVVSELVAQLMAAIGGYLEVEMFPARLLARKYREAREICRVEMGREEGAGEGVEEPADFSHCFR
jgi:hypothetical protein